MKITDLERAALRNMLNSGYDGPEYWDFCATGGIVKPASVGGVVASLQRKGFVVCQGRGSEATITLTDAGIEASK